MNKNYLSIGALVVLVAVGAYWLITSSPKAPEAKAELTGTVVYWERVALPEGSRIEVTLQDVSRADAPAVILAEQSIVTTGENVPIPFVLAYDPSAIDERFTYSVAARILVNDELRWISTDHIPVLTNGNPASDVEILVSMASPSASAPSNGSSSGSVNLEGSTFRLVSASGITVPSAGPYLLTFENGRVGVKFCNSMGGTYTLENGVLSGQMVSTLMYCGEPAGLMDLESRFGSLMHEGAAVTLTGNTLTLSGKDGVNMVFTAQVD